MQLTYDELTDTLYVYFSQEPVARTVEQEPRIIVDYDAKGDVRGIEIIGASERVTSRHGHLPRRDDVARLMRRTQGLPVPA
jgi:uncharacterized protein YuzE